MTEKSEMLSSLAAQKEKLFLELEALVDKQSALLSANDFESLDLSLNENQRVMSAIEDINTQIEKILNQFGEADEYRDKIGLEKISALAVKILSKMQENQKAAEEKIGGIKKNMWDINSSKRVLRSYSGQSEMSESIFFDEIR